MYNVQYCTYKNRGIIIYEWNLFILFLLFYFGFNIGIRIFSKKPRSERKYKEMTFVLLFALFTIKAFVANIKRRDI